jgi:hypothetical protein
MSAAPKQNDQDFDVRTLVEKPDIRAYELDGREWTFEIARVVPGKVYSQEKKTAKSMPMVFFKGPKKPLGLNATNLAAIGAMYGFRAKDWIGKKVTIYPTKTTFGRKQVDCIRVRPGIPSAAVATELPPVPIDEASLREQEEAARAAELEEQ